MGYRGGSLRHGGTDLLALQGLGQHAALDVFHLQTQQRGHGRGQVHVADFAQLRAALQLIGICFFDAVYTQGQANGASPALQQIQLAGVVLHVGIEVKVRDDGVAQPLLIETKKRLDQLGISGQRPELFPWVGRIPHVRAEDQFQILPMEKLGFFKMGRSKPECRQPLGQDVLGILIDPRNGPQQRGEDQNSGRLAPE